MTQNFDADDSNDDFDPKHRKADDVNKCVVCGCGLGAATFGKVCMKCLDVMSKRSL